MSARNARLSAIQPSDPASMQIADYVGAGGYTLFHSSSERHANELATIKVFNIKAASAEEQFYTTSYWAKPTCSANPFLGIKNFTVEGWFRFNPKEYGK